MSVAETLIAGLLPASISTSSVLVQPPESVTVTTYTPRLAVVVFVIIGSSMLDINPFGPDHIQAVPSPPTSSSSMSWPGHISVSSAIAKAAGTGAESIVTRSVLVHPSISVTVTM